MTPSLRRIRWRLVWLSAAALLLALASFTLRQWVYAASDDQCFWKPEGHRVRIREILPGGAAHKAGLYEFDELVSIQGQPITARTMDELRAFIQRQPAGREILYQVRRDGRDLSLTLQLVRPFDYVGLSVLLSGLVAWGIGLLVVVSSPQRKVARHFFYMGTIALVIPLDPPWAPGNMPWLLQAAGHVLSGIVVSFATPLWLHFFLRFPHPFPFRRNRTFLGFLYGGFLAAGLLNTLVNLAETLARSGPYGDLSWMFVDLQPVHAAFQLLMGLAVIAGVALFWRGSLILPRKRRMALMPALLFTTFVCIDLATYTYLSTLAQGKSMLFQQQAWFFFAPLPLLPLSFAYAILRHGFFDVRRAILRWLTYLAVVGATLTLYFLVLAWVLEQGIQTFEGRWVGVFAGLTAWPIGWALRRLLRALRKMFRRDLNTTREAILGALRDPRNRFSEEALFAALARALRENYHPHALYFLPVTDRSMDLPGVLVLDPEDPRAASHAKPLPLRLPLALIRNARDYGELSIGLAADESDWIREQGWEIRARVDALDVQVMVLLLASGEPHTAVLLGGKYAELNYGRDDHELLREVAVSTGILLETALLHKRIVDQERIEQELQTARRIQEGLVPSEAPAIEGYDLALRLEPALETGGDLLWLNPRGQGRWLAAVGDVSGKGLAAALYMSQATALLEFAARQESMALDQLLLSLDHTLRQLMRSRDFLTLCLLEWDATGHYRLVRAGHPPPLLIRGIGREDVLELQPAGRGLGLRPATPGNWAVHEGLLQEGEWLVLYSDGLSEAVNQEGQMLGLERFKEQMQVHWAAGDVQQACDSVFEDTAGSGASDRDDRTLLVLRRRKD